MKKVHSVMLREKEKIGGGNSIEKSMKRHGKCADLAELAEPKTVNVSFHWLLYEFFRGGGGGNGRSRGCPPDVVTVFLPPKNAVSEDLTRRWARSQPNDWTLKPVCGP